MTDVGKMIKSFYDSLIRMTQQKNYEHCDTTYKEGK